MFLVSHPLWLHSSSFFSVQISRPFVSTQNTIRGLFFSTFLDGVMIQITAETMDSLRQALRDMKDFTITCGKADQEENQELVHIQWTEDDHNFNKG